MLAGGPLNIEHVDERRACNYIAVVTRGPDIALDVGPLWKNQANRRAHGLRFETARLVFDDPYAASRRDPYPDEPRWQTIGMAGNVVLLVVHTRPEPDSETGEEIGRIISARKATMHERRAYEEGNY